MEPHDNFDPFQGVRSGFVLGRHEDGALRVSSGLVPGLALVAIGALFFLNNVHLIYVREWLRYWPAILIALGIVKLVDATVPSGRMLGGILTGFGAIFLARSLGFLDITMRDVLPLFLVGLGLMMLVQRTGAWHVKIRPVGDPRPVGPDTLNVNTVFGGAKRVVSSQDFKGGEVVAIFGGVELDLRQAGIVGDSAVLEIDAIFGGVEVKIPQHWSAVVDGSGIFGGYSDESLQPNPAQYPGAKQLIVRGTAVFGGVEVKN